MVGEPVEERAGEPLGAEDLGRFIERQVRGHQDRAALVSLGEDLEEEFDAGLGERHEAEFVDDQEAVFRQLALEAQQTFFIPRLHQFVDQGGGRGEADGEPLLASRQSEAQDDMGFAGAAGPDDEQIALLGDPLAGDELLEERSVEPSGRAIVDVFDGGLGMAEPGVLEPGLQASAVPFGGLAVEQEGEPFGEMMLDWQLRSKH